MTSEALIVTVLILLAVLSVFLLVLHFRPHFIAWQARRDDIKAARREAETYGRRFGPK